MKIEIHRPELEALILDRLRKGGFANLEEVLLQALKTSLPPVPEEPLHPDNPGVSTGADLVAAMQASPCKDIALEPPRHPMPVRDSVV